MSCPKDGPEIAESSEYRTIRHISSGSFGFVELAMHQRTGQRVAIKWLPRGEKISKYVLHEILNHSRLRHPHIVNFKEVYLTQKSLAIVMEFVPGGDMFDHVRQRLGLAEDNARWFFQQLIVSVDYLHKMDVAFRDVKLENILLDSSPRPLIKLCDFGYSKHVKFQSAAVSRVGTPPYMAPEIILNVEGQSYDGKMADIWSCGVALYAMLVGSYPFEREGDKESEDRQTFMMQRILRVDYDFPQHAGPSANCKDLLKRILVADPQQRATLKEIQSHTWYLQNLPSGVLTMNDKLMHGKPHQSKEEISKIVKEAQECDEQDGCTIDEYLDLIAEATLPAFEKWDNS